MIEIFKTNLINAKQCNDVKATLKQVLPNARIVFDLEDCDRILKIDVQHLNAGVIKQIIRSQGYEIEILD